MPNQQLIDYINQKRQEGVTDAQTRQELSAMGWPQSEIDEHLGLQADEQKIETQEDKRNIKSFRLSFGHPTKQTNGTIGTEKSRSSWLNRHPILSVIFGLFFLLILLLIIGGGSDSPINNPTGGNPVNEISRPAQIQQPALELKSIRFYQEYGYTHAEGEVKNIGSQPLQFVEVYTEFRDSSSNLITSEYSFLELTNFLSGQTSAFKNTTKSNPAISLEKSTIKFIGRIGDSRDDVELPYEDSSTPVYPNTPALPKAGTLAPDDIKNIITSVIQSNSGLQSLDKVTYDGGNRFIVEATSEYSTANYIIQIMFEVVQGIASEIDDSSLANNISPVIYLKFNTSTGYVESTTTLETLKQIYNKRMSKNDWKSVSNVNAVGLY